MGLLNDLDQELQTSSYKFVWKAAGYTPHKHQQKFHDNNSRYRALIAGIGSGKCVEENTLIWMADGTRKPIKKVVPGDLVWSTDDYGNLTSARVRARLDTGMKDGVEVRLYGGQRVVVSRDHPFLTGNTRRVQGEELRAHPRYDPSRKDPRIMVLDNLRWEKVGNLGLGDYVAIPHRVPHAGVRFYHPEMYELLGLILGDGCITNRSVGYSGLEQRVIDRVKYLLGRHFPEIVMKHISGPGYALTCKLRDQAGHGYNPLVHWLREIGLMGRDSKTKFVPEFVFKSDLECIAAFVSGLVVTDGYVSDGSVGYGSISRELASGYEHCCRLLGWIPTWRDSGRPDHGRPRPLTKEDRVVNGRYLVYESVVSRPQDLVGIECSLQLLHKGEKLTRQLNDKFGVDRIYTQTNKGPNRLWEVQDLQFRQISDITNMGMVHMYDLEIEGTHNFVGNGICLHNTMAGAAEVVRRALEAPGSRYLVCAATYPMLKRSTIVEVMSFIREDLIEYYNRADNELKFKNGSIIWFVSMEDPDKQGRGPTVAGVWVDEGSYISEYAFIILTGRIRQPGYWQGMWITTTPKGYNYLYKYFVDLPSKDEKLKEDYWYVQFSTKENPYLTEKFIKSLESTHSGTLAKQEIEGQFVGFQGQVYSDYLASTHVTDCQKRGGFQEILYLHDFGYTNPMVCLACGVDGDGRIYILEEWYETQKTQEDLIKARREMVSKYGSGIGIADPSEPGIIESLNRADLPTSPGDNSILEGIQMVSARLKLKGDGRARIVIDPSCKNVQDEFMKYRYADNLDGKPMKDKPLKESDHALDAIRYGVMYLDKRGGELTLLNNDELDRFV